MHTPAHIETISTAPADSPLLDSPVPTPLLPLVDHDKQFLDFYLALSEDAAAVAARCNGSLADIIAWTTQPHICAYIRAYRTLRIQSQRDDALAELQRIANTSGDPLERRRAAGTLLRATDPARWARLRRLSESRRRADTAGAAPPDSPSQETRLRNQSDQIPVKSGDAPTQLQPTASTENASHSPCDDAPSPPLAPAPAPLEPHGAPADQRFNDTLLHETNAHPAGLHRLASCNPQASSLNALLRASGSTTPREASLVEDESTDPGPAAFNTANLSTQPHEDDDLPSDPADNHPPAEGSPPLQDGAGLQPASPHLQDQPTYPEPPD